MVTTCPECKFSQAQEDWSVSNGDDEFIPFSCPNCYHVFLQREDTLPSGRSGASDGDTWSPYKDFSGNDDYENTMVFPTEFWTGRKKKRKLGPTQKKQSRQTTMIGGCPAPARFVEQRPLTQVERNRSKTTARLADLTGQRKTHREAPDYVIEETNLTIR